MELPLKDNAEVSDRRFLSTGGRIGRLQYSYQVFLIAILSTGLLVLGEKGLGVIFYIFAIIAAFFVMFPASKRFHDLNLSGWYVITLLVPVLSIIPGIILLLLPGTKGANRFGPSLASVKGSGGNLHSSTLEGKELEDADIRTSIPNNHAAAHGDISMNGEGDHSTPKNEEPHRTSEMSSDPAIPSAEVTAREERDLYARAWEEVQADDVDKGTWAKAFAEIGAENEELRARYIKERAQALLVELRASKTKERERILRERENIKQAKEKEDADRAEARRQLEVTMADIRRRAEYVFSVESGSIAESVGLQRGDFVVSYAGHDLVVSGENLRKLIDEVALASAPKEIEIEIVRNGERKKLVVPPGTLGFTIGKLGW